MTSQSVSDDLGFYNSTANTGPLATHQGQESVPDDVGDRVGQLEKGLLEIRNLFKQLVAVHQHTPHYAKVGIQHYSWRQKRKSF